MLLRTPGTQRVTARRTSPATEARKAWNPMIEDAEILEYIAARPRSTLKAIAIDLGLSTVTVQRRVSNLMQHRHLDRLLVVNYDSLGYRIRFRIDVTVELSNLDSESRSIKAVASAIKHLGRDPQFRGSLFIKSIQVLLGSLADLSISIRARNTEVVFAFVTDGLRVLPGVRSTSSVQEAEVLDETPALE